MQQNSKSTIEERVMANVGTIYTMRVLTGATALKIYALILSIWAIGRLAWVAKVFDNFNSVARSGTGAEANFWVSALEHAHIGVQIALIVAAVAFITLVLDIVRNAAPAQRFSF